MTNNDTFILPASNTIEENVIAFVKRYNKIIKPGNGFFFDYSQTSKLEKPLVDYMTNKLGWKLEYNNKFLRRPE